MNEGPVVEVASCRFVQVVKLGAVVAHEIPGQIW